MKLLSILLRIVAIAGAAFCVYAWLDTKGKTSESMEHMKDVAGETLQARTAQVPAILRSKAKTESDLKKTEADLKSTKETLATTETELKDERDRVVQAQEEILDKNTQIKSLSSKVSNLETVVATSETEIVDLKNEIIKIKTESEPIIAGLNTKIAVLEESVANKDLEIAEAVAAVEKELNEKMAQMVKVASGETEEAVEAEAVYVPAGEVVTIIKANESNDLFVINKGSSTGFELNQKVQFLDGGNLIADLSIVMIQDRMAVCTVENKDIGIPETIFVGDSYEVVVNYPEKTEVKN